MTGCLGMPLRLRPEHGWYFLERDILESFARAETMLELALWTAEDYLADRVGISANQVPGRAPI